MPSCLRCCLSFLHSRRSGLPSPNSSLAGPSDDAANTDPPRLDFGTASTSRPLRAVPGNDVFHPSTPVNQVDHPNSAGHPVVERVVHDFDSQPSQASWPVIPSGIAQSNATQTVPDTHDFPQPIFLASPSDHTYSEYHSAPQSVPAIPSQPPIYPFDQYLPQPQRRSQGMFYGAHDLNVTGTFVDASVTYNDTPTNHFMEKLLEKTIPGAEFDSSDRDPPPRCQPGTRLAILERCLHFIHTCEGKRKMRWVVGAAGVGKSAVMQSVVESLELQASCHASVFFSVNGRSDGTKAFITISYQFAAKFKLYRQLVERMIVGDPALLRASMAKQFFKLIAEPFIHNPQLNAAGRILIVIDGLDECGNPRTQQEILRLIFDLCITYPSSPLIWLIASRPEQHITSFFSRADVMPVYEKEEIEVDSDGARADVGRFLRDELKKIKEASDSVDQWWPEERDLWKLADASGGLFAYAQAVVRYIGDSTIASPASQLSDVLNLIDNHSMTDVPPEDHPMAFLDALYARILSKVPPKIMINARRILLTLVSDGQVGWRLVPTNFLVLCNWLGMTPDEAYANVNHLRCVLQIPTRDAAHRECLQPFHKSFIDYISDSTRSSFSPNVRYEARQLMAQCAFRVLNEAPDGIDFGDVNYEVRYGTMRGGLGTGDKISLTWQAGAENGWDDNETRLSMYKLAIKEVIDGMQRRDSAFQSKLCVRPLITLFEEYSHYVFPFDQLRELVFDKSRRHEFMKLGILNQMPLKAIVISTVFHEIQLQFRCRATTPSDPWNSSCKHKRRGKWGERDDQDWTTSFQLGRCKFCKTRLQHQLGNWKTRSPYHTVLTLFTSTGDCCVEFQFVDPDDGMSDWTYWFWLELSSEERNKYGSTL
ncbi:hypothetical protein AGABI1DRAFT_132533 [Agaricus bisporus var. burnettii JB137-S8]|uniref:Nephrocystin 3-like N-terminal domain-containing protein n=1 Tax=Agaricus bisporus var. burnettii (strain JB137-S8 / ATCC MYA-4627 / FGSC 10392) TaxID=597362 RepID=K5WX85_AGABU|nr:uncharacterized protein AGABI1DRAFT_132533 [Agaricus bisporus var. burnettii JB137-S8]EKM75182.1 hypothetical protein AGABI1DRAFT_132533 [Agaricus bisporus var. burnettii JB137-S8]